MRGDPPSEYGALRKKATLLAEVEKTFYQQRAKSVYLKNSNRSTKFFHDLVKRNNKRGAIITLTKQSGEQTSSLEEVANEFVVYYQGLLGASEPCIPLDSSNMGGRRLSEGQMKELIMPVADEEIRLALFDIRKDKAPGPDGFKAKFFTSAWDMVGAYFFAAIREFFQHGQLLKQWIHSLIALIPKSNHSPRVSNFRPISCCTGFYKVILKVLAGRLAKVMDALLDLAQWLLFNDALLGRTLILHRNY